jgi:phosphoglycerate dehydrogenase-like enzyme
LLKSAAGIEVEVRTGLKGEDLRKALMDSDGAICRSGVKITAEVLEGNRRLKAIARAGVGVDNIDLKAATRLGILVMNTPGGNTISTAEQAITLMMALSRNTHPAYQSLIEGRWDRKKFTGTQLAGKTLGIVGLGRIGQAVAKRTLAMEMRVLAYDPFLTPQRAKELGVIPCATVRKMLPEVDYLTVHTPLTNDTRNPIGPEEIAIMKLVGASDFYIQGPFLVDGASYAFLGAIITSVIFVIFSRISLPSIYNYLELRDYYNYLSQFGLNNIGIIFLFQLIVGLVLGIGCSIFAVKKHLK